MAEDFEYQLQSQHSFAQAPVSTETASYTHTDPNDGTVYEWDAEKRGWFPKIDGTFLAAYHSNYGYYNSEETSSTQTTDLTQPKKEQDDDIKKNNNDDHDEAGLPDTKKKKQEPTSVGWFDIDDERNTNVYVSGLHIDTTDEEFLELVTKCGIIMNDDNGHPKIKMYCDSEGNFKGDALCCYLKIESVSLAMQLLDESEFKGQKIHVERAKFSMKGNYNPSLKKRKKPNKKKKPNHQEKLLNWREAKPGPKRTKVDRIVIFKHLFLPEEFENDPMLINEIKDDLKEECSKMGEVKKLLMFDRSEEGVASVAFKDFEAAEKCILAMNGRFYGGRQLEVSLWDGVTNYEVEETEQERQKRLTQWESYLEGKDKKEEQTPSTIEQTTPTIEQTPPTIEQTPPTIELQTPPISSQD